MTPQSILPRLRLPRPTGAVATLLLLAGCASTHGLAPEGRAVDADRLAVARSFAEARLSDAAFPRQDWWTAFGDPQLDALVAEALAGNPSLDAADARVRAAAAQAGLADAARKPALAAGGQYSGIRIPETIAPAPLGGDYKGIVLLDLDLKYAPDLWGGKRSRWQAALGQAHAAEAEAQAARLTLSADVVDAYVALAQAFESREVALAEGRRAGRLRTLAAQRVDAGLDNQVQLRQADSAVAGAGQQAEAAQRQIDTARNALAALLGRGPDRGLDIDRPGLLSTPAPGVPDVLPSELLGHRADVVAARWRVEAASHGIDASKADFYPSVNLAAMVGLASGGLSDLFTSKALLVQGGPAISLPVFDGGALRSRLARSDADYDLAVADYNRTLVAALHEVADALDDARQLDAQLDSAIRAREAAGAAHDLAASRYRAGLSTRLDVLAAQRPLLQLDEQIAALRAQRLLAAVALDRALGGGLALAAVEAPGPHQHDTAEATTP